MFNREINIIDEKRHVIVYGTNNPGSNSNISTYFLFHHKEFIQRVDAWLDGIFCLTFNHRKQVSYMLSIMLAKKLLT